AVCLAGGARAAFEHHVRRLAELDDDLRGAARHGFTAAKKEGHALPSPVLHAQLHHTERGRFALGRHTRLVAVLPILASQRIVLDVFLANRFDRPKDFDLLVAYCIGLEPGGRFHGRQREQLEQVVLEHVAEDADAVVVSGTVTDRDLLGRGDLYVIDVVAVPDRLENTVGESKDQHVLHGLLAQVVIDAIDLVLVEDLVYGAVEFSGAFEIGAERFFHDQTARAEFGGDLAVGLRSISGRCRRS
ncbi:hypothetical protein LCGC14_2500720, partial [marine sediment metagenome]